MVAPARTPLVDDDDDDDAVETAEGRTNNPALSRVGAGAALERDTAGRRVQALRSTSSANRKLWFQHANDNAGVSSTHNCRWYSMRRVDVCGYASESNHVRTLIRFRDTRASMMLVITVGNMEIGNRRMLNSASDVNALART